MKINISKVLLLFLVSLSFYRIDLAAGTATFLLTPPLVISIFIIIIFIGSLFKTKNVPIFLKMRMIFMKKDHKN